MTTDREYIVEAAEKVRGGTPLRRYSPDTIRVGGRCAQLVRETVEGGLGIPANSWEVAQAAHDARKKRGGVDRWAIDYEAAVRVLGLTRPSGSEAIPGDVLYWPYKAKNGNDYGHTAIYLGNGLILENSDIDPSRALQLGSKQPLGVGSQVFVTPITRHGKPRTIAIPTTAIRLAETPPVVAVPPLPEWVPLYDPASGQAIPGEFVSVRRRGAEFRLFKVPKERLAERGLA